MGPKALYSLLAVPSDASENDIRNSFMSLVLCLHPDKQPKRPHGEEEKEEFPVTTSDLFNEIERYVLVPLLWPFGLCLILCISPVERVSGV